jgi:hypothetical protein
VRILALLPLALALACGTDNAELEREVGDAGECVASQDDPMNCGACGRTCLIPNATAACEQGECTLAACPAGFSDEDGEIANGCESSDEEPPLPGDPDAGMQEIMCQVGNPELCNAFDDNCNGQCDEGRDGTCRQGVHRASGNGHIFTTVLSEAQSGSFNLESQNYFRTYAAPGVGLVEVFLCQKSNSKYLLSTSSNCEGQGTVIRSSGYWAAEQECGSVPLHRLFHAPSGNHFYTLSVAERNNATNNLGYESQGIAGYVWNAP